MIPKSFFYHLLTTANAERPGLLEMSQRLWPPTVLCRDRTTKVADLDLRSRRVRLREEIRQPVAWVAFLGLDERKFVRSLEGDDSKQKQQMTQHKG